MSINEQADTLREKLIDAATGPVELEPDEAERAGAFTEDALSEQDAIESRDDLIDGVLNPTPSKRG